jgi:hypothetical protein
VVFLLFYFVIHSQQDALTHNQKKKRDVTRRWVASLLIWLQKICVKNLLLWFCGTVFWLPGRSLRRIFIYVWSIHEMLISPVPVGRIAECPWPVITEPPNCCSDIQLSRISSYVVSERRAACVGLICLGWRYECGSTLKTVITIQWPCCAVRNVYKWPNKRRRRRTIRVLVRFYWRESRISLCTNFYQMEGDHAWCGNAPAD